MLTADAGAGASPCAWARRERAWTLAYSGMAIAARMPMIATTIINSMRVKPRGLPSSRCCLIRRLVIYGASVPPGSEMVSSRRADGRGDRLGGRSHGVHIVCHSTRDGTILKRAPKAARPRPGLVHRWALDAVLLPGAQKRTRGGIIPSPRCASSGREALRKADGGTVAAVRDGKRAGGGAGVAVRAPAGRPRRYRSHEGPAGLPLGIRDHGGEGGQRAGERAHVSGVDADGRREDPGIGLSLGQARTSLDVGIQRNGDRGEDADDRDNDHQLDEGEASWAAEQSVLPDSEIGHLRCLRSPGK